MRTIGLVLAVLGVLAGDLVRGEVVRVGDDGALRAALGRLSAGSVVLIEPGRYRGGIYIGGVAGREGAPVAVRGADPQDPPVFEGGGGQAFHLADCSWFRLANVVVQDYPLNGINIDDGGSFETPAHHILVENVRIRRTGPTGNHDALKMSGVDHFIVRGCEFVGWGGSGVDMVGCHYGVVDRCRFTGLEGYSQSNAVQLKGGTREVLVQRSFFRDCGHRSINLGGSTGLEFFRPDVDHYEASGITIAGNCFVGSQAPVAWVTADGGRVHHNTIVYPANWVLRILQETSDARFRPSHDGVFEMNVVVFDSRVRTFVNVGPRTAPETFVFRGNAWIDAQGERRPSLPTQEQGGVYNRQVELSGEPESLCRLRVEGPGGEMLGAAGYKVKEYENRWP